MPGRFIAGIAALVRDPQTSRYLLLRRTATKDFAPGVWECVTGRVEQGESFEDALRREVREELGAEIAGMSLLDTAHFHRGEAIPENELLGVVYTVTLTDPSAIHTSAEHTEHRWLSTAEADALLTATDPSTEWIRATIHKAESLATAQGAPARAPAATTPLPTSAPTPSLHITAAQLRQVIADIFAGGGAPRNVAEQVADSLVEANLTGHDSHGVLRVTYYVRDLLAGIVKPAGQVTTLRESPTTALLDGGGTFGMVAVQQAMDLAIRKAKSQNVGVVAIRNTHHTGRMGQYVVQAAEAGCMGLVFCRPAAKGGIVAPHLGTSRALNTNPIAWGIPAGEHPPVFSDFATSIRAAGKLEAAVDQGRLVPDGWLLDAEGTPTNDPAILRRGGVLLPFGEHKGYALGAMVELVAGALTSTGTSLLDDFEPDYATVVMAVNIEAFCALEDFGCTVERFVASIKAGRRAPGVEEILVPGEPEWRTREQRLRDGLVLPAATWQRIVEAGNTFGVRVALPGT